MAAAATGRRGPKPRFTREQLVDTAIALVDEHGFNALTIRAVSRELDVTPMALYRYVQSSDELVSMVLDRLIELKTADAVLPTDWRQALHTFAATLVELVGEHPSLLQAYAGGAVHSPAALQAAEALLRRLRDSGLSIEQTAEIYAAVHAIALGHALHTRAGTAKGVVAAIDPARLPTVVEVLSAGHSVGFGSLHSAIDLAIGGILNNGRSTMSRYITRVHRRDSNP